MRYLQFVLFAFWVFSSCLAEQPNAAESTELIAFSLGRAERKAVKNGHRLGTEVACGMTDVIGFILEPVENDIVLLGRRRARGTVLGPDELSQLLRASAVGGLTGPGVSLEPLSANNLQAVYFGGNAVSKSWIGRVSHAGDLSMKELGLGAKAPCVVGLKTYADRMVERMSKQPHQNWEVLSRFWFSPASLPVLVHEGLWLLVESRVGVLVENLEAKVGGVSQRNFKDEAAEQWAAEFMRRFGELSAQHPEFADIQAMMGSLQMAALLLQHASSNRLAYWLNGYKPRLLDCPDRTPMIRRKIDGSQIEVHGGVRAAGLAIRIRHNDLGALREAVLRARPKDRCVPGWRVAFDRNFVSLSAELAPEQMQAARRFAEGARLRENHQFEKAAAEFEAAGVSVLEAVEPRFLASVCRREALVAAARVNELDRPIRELRALAAAYPYVPEIQYELAVSLCVVGRQAEAVPLLEGLLFRVREFTSAQHALGMAHYRLGNRDQAAKWLGKFLQNAPRGPLANAARKALAELTTSPKTARTVVYDNGLFSCSYPANWKELSGSEAKMLLSGTASSRRIEVAFVLPQNPDCNVVISVAPFPLNRLTTEQVNQSLSRIEQSHRSRCQGFRLIDKGSVEVGGVVGVRFIFACQRLGLDMKQSVTTLVSRSNSVTITCTATESLFETHRDTFDLINDVRFTTLTSN